MDRNVITPTHELIFFQRVIAEGWKIPKSNEEWTKYNKSISISEAGFYISQEHINILQKHKIL